MAKGTGTVTVNIVGKADKLNKALGDAESRLDKFSSGVGRAGANMTKFVSVPIVGFLGMSTKAAIEDEAAQAKLAKTLELAVGANKKVVAETENYITKMMKASTFADDELRPSYETLVRSTNDVREANKLLAIAMDVATAKGIPLETATLAVAKANEGQYAAANKLIPGLVDLKDKTQTTEQVMSSLARAVDGQASAALETNAGKAKAATRDMGELSEKLGAQLTPAFSKLAGGITDTVIPALDRLTGDNGALVLVGVAAAGPVLQGISKLKDGVYLLNGAFTTLMANPGIAALAIIATQVPKIINDVNHLQSTTQSKGFLSGLREFVFGKGGGSGFMNFSARDTLRSLGVPGFDTGGVVPGATGSAQLAMVHGGETILPTHKSAMGGGRTIMNFYVQGSVVTANQLIDEVHSGLLRKQRTQGDLGFEAA